MLPFYCNYVHNYTLFKTSWNTDMIEKIDD